MNSHFTSGGSAVGILNRTKIFFEHRITGGPQDYEVEASDTATFRCNAVYDSDLELKIKWLKDGELIDFETEPRFIQSSDQSLTITKTTELDSGTYTCLAQSDLDSAQASATLIVQVSFNNIYNGDLKFNYLKFYIHTLGCFEVQW